MISTLFPLPIQDPLRQAVSAAYRMSETECIQNLLAYLDFNASVEHRVLQLARKLVLQVRKKALEQSGIRAFMLHYDLTTEEGIMLLCLAEAILRIPDTETENLLIREKLTHAHWEDHLHASESSFVNIATWGLALTGKILQPLQKQGYFRTLWRHLLRRTSEPVIRQAIHEAIKILSHQFVVGRTIGEALTASGPLLQKGYWFSYDMLGEAARTAKTADDYFKSYQQAISAIASQKGLKPELFCNPSISVKLSALYPRYEPNHRELAIPALIQRMKVLALQAKRANISLIIDAEEADRLEMSLDIFAALASDPEMENWEGLGLAVQAYQKRAMPVIQWLITLARQNRCRIPVRLVKGAYWDSEVRWTQMGGLSDYPVFTHKANTDVSYLACAKVMLQASDALYSQFATHNAYTAATILTLMSEKKNVEFQSLYGMGVELHDQIMMENIPCRVYAPVGEHKDLLPYLVRRLLENGANSSFVHQIADSKIAIERLVVNPVARVRSYANISNPKIPLPQNLYAPGRLNSKGIDLSHYDELKNLSEHMQPFMNDQWNATSLNQSMEAAQALPVVNPSDCREIVGYWLPATEKEIEQALQKAVSAYPAWNKLGMCERILYLEAMANILEKNIPELCLLVMREAGRTLNNVLAEIREAIDYCRYYSQQARQMMKNRALPGPTGESNTLSLQGRGVILSISPWNFPIAIFTGQLAAALITGNAVIVKPAEQTPLIAGRLVQLFHQAGIPKTVLQLLLGSGDMVGASLVADPRIQGVLFTGSTETAKAIHRSLAERSGPIVPFIAETGGINAMIVDSTALPEQVVSDVVVSAFDSAGQRCSSLRILLIQEEVAETMITLLKGAMEQLRIGNPLNLATDIGPVIDEEAKASLVAYELEIQKKAKLIAKAELPHETHYGLFISPQAYELPDFSLIKREVFGPILHVIRYQREKIDQVIAAINALGYGLTFGIHSRIDASVEYIQNRIQAGNIYVNRNMIGAVVGVQPFGGYRLSGTGPKAGGPHYLNRLCVERTLTINTAATGGDVELMALED